MRNKKILTMTECAMMIALSFVLSWVVLWEMPAGGSVTLASMLPIMLVAVKYGPAIGIGTAAAYSLTQLAQAIIKANVFIYCNSFGTVAFCAAFDYILPFTALGLAGIFARKFKGGAFVGMIMATAVRFLCHFAAGVVIWGQWAPEGVGKFAYSLGYNASFLALDLAICLAVAAPLLQVKQIKKLLGLA